MKKHAFSIIKKSRFRFFTALALSVCSVLVFSLNLNFSEEFTGGVSLSLLSQQDVKKLEGSLHNYLDERNYPASHIFIDTEGKETSIKVNSKLQSDDQVAQLSEDIKTFLLEKEVITSPQDIIGQTII